MATPQFLTKNPNFLHEAFLDIYTADPRWLRLSDNFYENHDRLLYTGIFLTKVVFGGRQIVTL